MIMKQEASSVRATLIGDLVGSRKAPSRAKLHHTVNGALADAAGAAIDPPRFTVGDEFQASYRSIGEALDAALAIRLTLAPEIDVRYGIGWGEVTVLDTEIQDGPGWWSAREAIEWVADVQRQPGLALVRSAFRSSVTDGPEADALNAALLCRDQLLGSLDGRSVRLLRGLLQQQSKKELAAMEGISASAVSQRTARDGLDLLTLVAGYLGAIR